MPVSSLILMQSEFFQGCSPAVVAFAAQRMELVWLRKREALLPAGKTLQGLAVVAQGSLQALGLTQDGREVAVQSAGLGGVIGLERLLAHRHDAPLHWIASVGPATVAWMSADDALALLSMEDMALRAARWLAQALCDALAWQRLVSIHPVMARVCACLLWLLKDDGTLVLPTHAELGWRLNTTRESITRTLQRLQQERVLQRQGDHWQVLDLASLRRLAQPEE